MQSMASSGDLQSKNVKAYANYAPLLPISAYHSSYPSESNESWSIIKIILLFFPTLVSTIIILKLSLNMIMMYSIDPESPTIQLNSLFISGLAISGTKLAAKSSADFTILDPNLGLDISLEGIDSYIFYKQEDALMTTIVEGFHLGLRQPKNGYIEIDQTTGFEGVQPVLECAGMRKIIEDLEKSGTLSFSLKLNVPATYHKSLLFGNGILIEDGGALLDSYDAYQLMKCTFSFLLLKH